MDETDEPILGVEITFKLTIGLKLNLRLVERVSNTFINGSYKPASWIREV
jgi:hypothetical protein